MQLFVVLCYFFMETDGKYFFGVLSAGGKLNSLQNDVCLNHLDQKLWEKIHFLQPKVNFSGDGKKHIKNTSI